MARFKSINDLVNQVAIEVGVKKVPDVFAAIDTSFAQLTALADSCGYELLQDSAWEGLVREHAITTQSTDSGEYDLPADFAYMINQTGWDQTNNVPLGGPLSAQDWQYLEGRDLVSSTIYASFREVENKFNLFPQPPPDGLEIRFEYISRNWVQKSGQTGVYDDKVTQPSDIVLFEPHLFERLLKLRFLEARGFDTTAAMGQYSKSFTSWSGIVTGAPIVNAGRGRHGIPYVNGFRITPDRGYGT